MSERWEAPGGLRVETVSLSLTGTGGDGTWLRVTRGGVGGRMLVGQVRTPAGLAGLGVDLAELTAE